MADDVTYYDPSTEYIDPDGDGGLTDWTAFGSGSSKADRVADGTNPPTAPDTTDGITTSASGNVQRITFPNPTGAWTYSFTVSEIYVHIYARQSQSVSRDRTFDLDLTIGSFSWSGNIDTNSTSYAWHTWTVYDGVSAEIGDAINTTPTFFLDITSVATGGGPDGDWDIAAVRIEIRIDRDHLWLPFNNHTSSLSPSDASLPDGNNAGIRHNIAPNHIAFGPGGHGSPGSWPIGKVELFSQYQFVDVGTDDEGTVDCALYANSVKVGPDFPLPYSETKAEAFKDVTRFRSWTWNDFSGLFTGLILTHDHPDSGSGDSCSIDFVCIIIHLDENLPGPTSSLRMDSGII